jgi:ATP-binding cassette subfamily B protein
MNEVSKKKKKVEIVKKKKLSIKEFLKVLIWVFKMYYRMSTSMLIMLIITRVLSNLESLFYAFLFGITLDKVISTSQSVAPDITQILPYLLMIFIYYVFADGLLYAVSSYSVRGLQHLSYSEIQRYYYEQLNIVGIQNLENPETADLIQRSQDWLYGTFQLLDNSISFIAIFFKSLTAGITIATMFPYMIPIILLLIIGKYIPEAYFNKLDFDWQVDNSEKKRIAWSTSDMLKIPAALQEINILGAYKFLDKKYTTLFNWYNKGLINIFKRRGFSDFILNVLDTLVTIFGYGVVFSNLLFGKISIGSVSFQISALGIFSNSMQSLLLTLSYMNDYALKMTDLVTLFNMQPAIPDGRIKLPILQSPPKIEFRKVSFKYPKADKYIFKNLSFKIDSSEKVALVGHNGAGKTTIVKLLARIYQATSGEILINDININDLTINDWYKNIGILFQDYNFYSHLSAGENISIGNTDKKVDKKKLIEAAKNADADKFINEYKNKYDQIMSVQFKDGIRPSTGQQQKIAIARFFYRDAPLAIFDEPTAAIDAVSEYNIFNKIYNFFDNKTVLIISHRFSTVRNADRIIVLEKGKIVEEGTHKNLLKNDGVYANAYKLQAEGYQG